MRFKLGLVFLGIFLQILKGFAFRRFNSRQRRSYYPSLPFNYFYGLPYQSTPQRRNSIAFSSYQRPYYPQFEPVFGRTMSPFYGQLPVPSYRSFQTPMNSRYYSEGRKFLNTVTANKRTIPDSKSMIRSKTPGVKRQLNKTLEMIDIPFKAKSPILSFHGRIRNNNHAIKKKTRKTTESKQNDTLVKTPTRKTFVDSLGYRDRFTKPKNVTGQEILHQAIAVVASTRNLSSSKLEASSLLQQPTVSGTQLKNDSTLKTGERRFKGKVIDVTVDEADTFEVDKDSSNDIEETSSQTENNDIPSKAVTKSKDTSSKKASESTDLNSKAVTKSKNTSSGNVPKNNVMASKSVPSKKNITDSDDHAEPKSQQAVGTALFQKTIKSTKKVVESGASNTATVFETESNGDSSELDIVDDDSEKKTTVNNYKLLSSAKHKKQLSMKKNETSKPVILVGKDNSFAGHTVSSNSTAMRNETSQTIFPLVTTTESESKETTFGQAVVKSKEQDKEEKEKEKQQQKPTMAQTIKEGFNNMAEAAVKLIKGEKTKDKKLAEYLKENVEKSDGKNQKQTTGEDIYGAPSPVNVKIVDPKAPHAIANDILKGDWFDTGHEPNQKTKNDIKMSSAVLGKIANAKLKGKAPEYPQLPRPLESKKQYENRVKKITNLAESTENDLLSNLIQDSLGAAMSDRKPLKLQNLKEKANKSPEKTDISEIQKLLSKYSDDFDVFVDKAVNHLEVPGVGQVVSKINTMDTLPENEKDGGVAQFDSVTGSKKNFKGFGHRHQKGRNITLIDNNQDDDDDTLMRRLAHKWRMFKEANKGVLEDSKRKIAIDENQSQKSHVVNTENKKGGSDVLKQYFDQVEQKQGLGNNSQDLDDRQSQRRERLKSTLHMITDIESEIDRLVNKETVESQHFDELNQKKDHNLKGKARIFKELTNNDDSASKDDNETSKAKDTSSMVIENFASNAKADVGDDLVGNQESAAAGSPTTKVFMGTLPEETEDATEEDDKSKEPQNFVATPQYEEEEIEPNKETSKLRPKPIELAEQTQPQQQFVRIAHRQQRPQLQSQIQEQNIVDKNQPMSLFASDKVPQQEVEEKQLLKSIEDVPGVRGSSNGKTIENTISSSDQNEHLEQAAFMKQFQQDELKGDMARVQEATQSGLRDMFNTAVQKQNNFITNVEGGPADQSFDGGSPSQPQQPLVEPHTIVAMPDADDANTEGETTPEGMAGDPQSMFGEPNKWQETTEGNSEPFNVIKDDIPDTDSSAPDEGVATRKSNIMRLMQSDDADDDDSNDEEDDEDSTNSDGTAMFMALPIAMPS